MNGAGPADRHGTGRGDDAAGGDPGSTIPDLDTATRLIRHATFRGEPAETFRIGVEAELIPIDRETRHVPSIEDCMLPVLLPLVQDHDWRIVRAAKGAPAFEVPGGGRLTFEPGGQIEYAAPPFPSPSAVLANLRSVIGLLSNRFGRAGIDLYGLGIDPFNPPGDASLQVRADRYRWMDAYYATFGPAGARMMRQTASIQLNIDAVTEPALTWQVLNALAPVLVGMFANSRRYAGRDTGFANFRSHTWQVLDRTRTGMPWAAGAPADHYAAFALDAPAMFIQPGSGEYHPFRHWIEAGRASTRQLADHLSTLFPEVRPRRYFEIRSIDAIPPSMYAAPIMLIAGLILDNAVLHTAAELLDRPDTVWLRRAVRHGLRDETLAQRASIIADLAIGVCRSKPALCDPADVDAAESFFADFTKRRRSPGDAAEAGGESASAA